MSRKSLPLLFFRMANARAKSEQAEQSAIKSEQDSDHARIKAKEYAPEFHQPGINRCFDVHIKVFIAIMKTTRNRNQIKLLRS